MHISEVRLTAAGVSQWVTIDTFGAPTSVGIGCILSNGASLTYSVEHTFDDLNLANLRSVNLTQTGTTVTVTDSGKLGNGHNLSVGDSVYIQGSGSSVTDGWFTVASIVSSNQYTYTAGTSQNYTGSPLTKSITARVFTHVSLAAQTARADGNYAFNISATRLHVTAWTSGVATMLVQSGLAR